MKGLANGKNQTLSAAIVSMLLVGSTPGFAQLTDLTQTPNAEKRRN